MNAYVIIPQTFDENSLDSQSGFSDSTSLWVSSHSYSVGDIVKIGNTGMVKYYCVDAHTSTNDNSPATGSNYWIYYGPTNNFAWADGVVGTQSIANTNPAYLIIKVPKSTDIALINIQADEVIIEYYDNGNPTSSKTIPLVGRKTTSWLDYFFEDLPDSVDLIISKNEALAGIFATVKITFSCNVNETNPRIGNIIAGRSFPLGKVEFGAKAGITDYSKKNVDEDFGTTSLIKRSYAKKMDLSLLVDNGKIRALQSKLASIRATPCLWVGSSDIDLAPLIVFGYYKDFSIDIVYETTSVVSLEIEGLI